MNNSRGEHISFTGRYHGEATTFLVNCRNGAEEGMLLTREGYLIDLLTSPAWLTVSELSGKVLTMSGFIVFKTNEPVFLETIFNVQDLNDKSIEELNLFNRLVNKYPSVTYAQLKEKLLTQLKINS